MSSDNFKHPMSADEFRKNGYALIDLIADYHENVPTPVAPVNQRPGELLSKLPECAPNDGEGFDQCLGDVRDLIIPSLTHWLSPSFFAYYPCNSSFPGILGELASAGLGQQGMMWLTSPACTELEMCTTDWLADALSLPEHYFHKSGKGGGVIQGSASEAILVAIVAARERKLSSLAKREPSKLVAYCSDQTHSSMKKACQIIGFEDEQLHVIPTERGVMTSAAFERAIEQDLKKGLVPFFVCATVGTTSSASVDPVIEIGELSQTHNLWMHIDAAYAGSACICPEYRPLLNGVELANSFCFNPHKWLMVSFDCSALFVKDKTTLVNALSVTPEYLRNKATESGAATDFRDWQIPLGRRLRALKLWFVMRSYGLKGLQDFIRHGVRLADGFESYVKDELRLELVLPRSFALVCFRVADNGEAEGEVDVKSKALLERLNESGKVFLTHTSLMGRYVIRASFGGQYTQKEHVDALQNAISNELDAMGSFSPTAITDAAIRPKI